VALTLVEHSSQTRLSRMETGVRRIPGPGEPVVIVDGSAAGDALPDVVLALLSRRRDVFLAPPEATPEDVPHRFALVIAPGWSTPLAADDRVSMMVVLGSPVPPARCPVLVLNPPRAECLGAGGSGARDVRYARASHPAEQAHLIDAFLRDPHHRPAGSWIPRARP
jgi:hypothetical protein